MLVAHANPPRLVLQSHEAESENTENTLRGYAFLWPQGHQVAFTVFLALEQKPYIAHGRSQDSKTRVSS